MTTDDDPGRPADNPTANRGTSFDRGVLFALPEYSRPFSGFVQEAIRALSLTRDPLYAQIAAQRTHILYPRTRISLKGGKVLDSPGVRVRMTMEFNASEIIAGDMDSVYQAIDSAAEQNVDQTMPYFFSQMSDISEAVGTTVDAGGIPMSWDLVNELLERIEIPFDHDGNPSIPALVLSPETAARIPTITPDQQRVRDEIIERKRQDFLARRRTRRLPGHPH